LEKKGFIIMKIGKPIKYIAVPPSEVIERVKKRVQNDAEAKTKIINELKESEVLSELSLLHNQGIKLVDPTDISGSIKGRDNLYNHLEATMKNAENEIIIMTSAQGFIRKVEAFKSVFEKLSKKGVSIKVACPLTKEVQKYLKEVKETVEARHTDDVKARFVIVDNKELVFMLLDDEEIHPTYDVGVWVNTPFFVGAISSFFNRSWEAMNKAE
jgi:sugar-specific transcriptional regulator TrmB